MYARPQCAQKRCYRCGTAKPESAFEVAARKARNADRRICKDCASNVKGEKAMEKPCFKCGVAKAEGAFGVAAWTARHADRRVCMRRESQGRLALRRVHGT